MFARRHAPGRPFFSVCIPQYNRTSFLLGVLDSLAAQDTDDFEVCVSDDCSTDGRGEEVIAYLERSRLAYAYSRSAGNLRYDGNLRRAIGLANGAYCFLLGNDDVLEGRGVLTEVRRALESMPRTQVAITNFEDYSTGLVTRRARETRILGAGPAAAVAAFRRFSFVSGVLLRTAEAHAASTERWDGSEMYQMYIASRIIARGGSLASLDLVTVRKDLRLPGESVDNYALRPRARLRGIPVQELPMQRIGRLMIDAITPDLARGRTRLVVNVIVQHLGVLYPFWLLEYRRVQSWRFAAGVGRDLRPGRSFAGVPLSGVERWCARLVFVVATVVGLALPLGLVRRVMSPATRLARRVGEWGTVTS